MRKLVGKYIARTDDGRTFQVLEYQDFIDAGSKDGADSIPGQKWLRLADGSAVNFIDERTWEIVSDGTILRRLR
jgi:hypothetical protein